MYHVNVYQSLRWLKNALLSSSCVVCRFLLGMAWQVPDARTAWHIDAGRRRARFRRAEEDMLEKEEDRSRRPADRGMAEEWAPDL